MKKVAIEEHCFTQHFVDVLQSRKAFPRVESVVNERGQKVWRWRTSPEEYQPWLPPPVLNRLCDLGDGRLKDMDEAGIDMQVISFSTSADWLAPAEATNLTRRINEIFYDAVNAHPDRYAALAAMSLRDPEGAAAELERAVKQLDFKGGMILPHVLGEYIDDRKYWPVFETAVKLDVPIYMHPTFPPPERQKVYAGYPELVGAMWGYSVETSLAAVRLICSGVFDRYSGLRIILGHMGEALPFWMSRLDQRFQSPTEHTLESSGAKKEGGQSTPLTQKLKKLPSQYIRDNFFVTTSGIFWEPVLRFVGEVLGIEKILFAVDYPFEFNKEAAQFIESARIPKQDKEKVCHLNAEKLLKLSLK